MGGRTPEIEDRHGSAGAVRTYGGFGGPLEAPHVVNPRGTRED